MTCIYGFTGFAEVRKEFSKAVLVRCCIALFTDWIALVCLDKARELSDCLGEVVLFLVLNEVRDDREEVVSTFLRHISLVFGIVELLSDRINEAAEFGFGFVCRALLGVCALSLDECGEVLDTLGEVAEVFAGLCMWIDECKCNGLGSGSALGLADCAKTVREVIAIV